MPSYFPEGTTPRTTDSFERLLQKAASLVSVRNGGADAPAPDDSRERTMYKFVKGLSAAISESSNLDSDALAYAAVSGAVDVAAIDAFVKGVKSLGLWDNMVCWPLRSRQNAGTGTVVHSLGGLGTFDGSIVNGATWGVDGITFNSNTQAITLQIQLAAGSFSNLSALKTDASSGNSHVAGLFSYLTSNPSRGYDAAIWGPTGNHVSRFNGLTGGNRVKGSAFTPHVGAGFFFNANGVTDLADPENCTGFTQQITPSNNTRDTTLFGSGVLPYTFSPNNFFLFGSGSVTRSEVAAFQAWFSGVLLSAGQVGSLCSLYKSTLGTGLGLP